MTARKKIITLSCIILAAVAAYFGARYGMDKYRDHLADKAYAAKIATIYTHTKKPDEETFHEAADRLHDFVRNNSQHKMDEEFYATWPDRMKLADAFIAGLEGKRKDNPHMECSTRSNLLAALHEKEGRRVRNVVMYSPAENLANHRIIEVLNPETMRWEAYDVTYDIYYRNKDTKTRVSTAETGANPDAHEACNTRGRCGWDLITDEKQESRKLLDYLKIITVHDKESGLRLTLHSEDVTKDRTFEADKGPGTFCDLFPDNCKQGFVAFSEGLPKTRIE